MKSLMLALMILSLLSACTAVKVIEIKDPERASDINAELGLRYMQRKQYKRALGKLKKAVKYNPENAQAYHYLAELYRRLDVYDTAEEYYKKSLEMAPEDPDTQNNYGIFLCDRGRYDKAYQYFDNILKDPLYSYKADAYENVGLCAYRQGKLKKAETAFKKALSINKRMAKSLIKLAQLSYDHKHISYAYEYFRRYIAIAPHNPESLWIGVLLEKKRGNKNTVASYKVLLKGKFPASKETMLLKNLEAQGKI